MTVHDAPDRAAIVRDGYVSVPSVLTAEEIRRLRCTVDAVLTERGLPRTGGMVLPNAAVRAPEIGWLLTHPPILAATRRLIGSDDVMFTFEADLHRNYIAKSWHKDTGEGQMPGGYFGFSPIGRDDCVVVKLAIYLQDHLDGSGLEVRLGSHRHPEFDEGPPLKVASRAGDVVFFDVRLTHRGTQPKAVDLGLRAFAKLFPTDRRGQVADALRRTSTAMRGQPDRLAIYFAFGLPHLNSEIFARRNMRRQLEDFRDANDALPVELMSAFTAAGVTVASIH